MTELGTLDEGGYTPGRILSQEAIGRCPHLIMMPEHYREDQTCRCNDPGAAIMADWGYRWSKLVGCWM